MNEDTPELGESVGLMTDRVRKLRALLGLADDVSAAAASDVIRLLAWLADSADERANPPPAALAAAAGTLARHLDEIGTAVLVERSTLGLPGDRGRHDAPVSKVAAILARKRELDSAGGDPAPEPGTAVAGRAGASCWFQARLRALLCLLTPGAPSMRDERAAAEIREHVRSCPSCLHRTGLELAGWLIVLANTAAAGAEYEVAEHLSETTIARILQLSPAVHGATSRPHSGRGGPGSPPRGSRRTVLVLGGDGFCGWPTALYLSDRGWDVVILDDLSRRKIDINLGVESLTPIRSAGERIRAWKEITGNEIGFEMVDLATQYERLVAVLNSVRPSAIVHFAEQRAAPYSMRNPDAKRYTVDNNVRGTHNLLAALTATGIDAPLVHLGTMGVYGYGWPGSTPIPEGYLTVKVPTPDGDVEREILHPSSPVSVYHLTKTLDQLMFAFYAANDGLRITDLYQGIVWGTQTEQTRWDERLINRFDYDGDYGTVLNRFLMQAAIGHPLTVHGSGLQTRAFIHIQDTVRCIELALEHPPEPGSRPKVLHQVTETFRVIDLAKLVADQTGTDIANLPNPRCEPEENDFYVLGRQFRELGLEPTTLSDGLLAESTEVAKRYRDRVDLTKIVSRSVWRSGMETASDLLTEMPVL